MSAPARGELKSLLLLAAVAGAAAAGGAYLGASFAFRGFEAVPSPPPLSHQPPPAVRGYPGRIKEISESKILISVIEPSGDALGPKHVDKTVHVVPGTKLIKRELGGAERPTPNAPHLQMTEKPIRLEDLKVGDMVFAAGHSDIRGQDSFEAAEIVVESGPPPPPPMDMPPPPPPMDLLPPPVKAQPGQKRPTKKAPGKKPAPQKS
ncbi:MAG TPA: hypothetical protein VFV50_08805 [Bdellovibrionales bacterium]|nr:hypothetical protein [Bdellovibrionales bacterium]